MLYNYDVEKLNNVMQDFYNATGVNISFITKDDIDLASRKIYNNDFCNIIQKSDGFVKKCYSSDCYLCDKCRKTKKAEKNICHAGLIDIAVPVIYEDEILGFFMLGQMKRDDDFSGLKKYLVGSGLELDSLEAVYKNLPTFDEDKVRSIINLASIVAEHILVGDVIRPRYNQIIESAIKYIDDNLENDLSVQEVAVSINASVSVIYKYFRLYFGCTPKDYINKKRVEKSKEILKNTNLPIETVARVSGFSSASYYTRVFKEINGITPLKYRKG